MASTGTTLFRAALVSPRLTAGIAAAHELYSKMCPSDPDRLYQQNHCGIYRLDRPRDSWVRIGKAMPKEVGDIGFPMVVHPRDANRAWVFPMDGQTVWPRTSLEGRPAVFGTRDGGDSWQRMHSGLPAQQAWWTVKRQAMSADAQDPVGLYFGTTSGELWMSRDEGEHWTLHRPPPARNLRRADGRDREPRVKILIPTPLLSYTAHRTVEAQGATLAEILDDLDRQ